MGVLFIISKPQGNSTAFEAAARMAQRGLRVAFLFIGEAAEGLTDEQMLDSVGFAEVYRLESSRERRGRFQGVRSVDYTGWVGLIETNEKIISWT